MMCSLRTVRPGSIWINRKYLPFFLVALAILLSQGFLAYSLYGLPESFKYTHETFQLETGPKKTLIAHKSFNASKSSSRLVKTTTALPFEPKCIVNSSDVISALNRAKTLDCKKQIAEIHCKQLNDELYPTRLVSTCPRNGNQEFVGCSLISDIASLHSPHYNANVSLKQPPVIYEDSESCIWACFAIGSPFAVFTENSKRCLCSNVSLDEWSHSKTCTACDNCDRVYKTGLPPDMPKKQPLLEIQKDTKRARIAFFLTVNGRSLRQVQRLIAALKNTAKINHFFFVHVDERQDYLYRSLKQIEDPSWIVVTPKRFSTIWGGATLLQMLLASYETLLSMSHWEWDYVINLSETDFPLKRVEVLEQFLYLNLGQNFVRSHGQETARFISKQALKKTFHECDTRMWKLGDRQLPTGIRFDGGSDWVSLHRDFVDWLIKSRYSNKMLEGLEKIYRQTLLPAESYFHTVLRNSIFCTKFVDNNLRFVNWRRKQGCKCQYKHIVDWCGCSPNVFLEDDHSRLMSLQKKSVFFGRKFEPVISQSIINEIELQIGLKPKTSTHLENLSSYWQNEFHHLDRSPPVDQGRLSAWTSLARMGVRHVANLGSHCVLRAARVLEAWLYFKEDNFEGMIINFEAHAEHLPEPVKSEAFFKKLDGFRRSSRFQNDRFVDRLLRLEVSTDFDVKELIARNFAGIIGPYSEPGVIHEWNAGPQGAITFVWIDPANVVAGSYEIKVSRAEQIQHHKPPLQKPLRPGVWQLKIFKDWVLMAETSFLVQPQTFYNGVPIKNASVSQIVNSGPKSGYTDADLTAVEEFLGFNGADIKSLIEQADTKSRWTSNKLDEWADALSASLWSLEGLCFIPDPLHHTGGVYCPQLPLEPCNYMPWSSLSPDKKSKI